MGCRAGGIDHILAMLGAGVLAATIGGKALYLVPLISSPSLSSA